MFFKSDKKQQREVEL
jgi:hypothetical protein